MKITQTIASLLLLLFSLPCTAAGIRYTPAASLTVINRTQPASSDTAILRRLDVDRYPQLTPVVRRYARYSTGLALRFRTDSPVIKARWTTGANATSKNTTPILQSGLDLYILRDGQWIFAGAGIPGLATQHESTVVDNMDGTMHECLMYLPMFNSVDRLEIGVDDDHTMEPADNPFHHHIVVIGSSITHGASASRPGLAFPARMERASGLEFTNLGFSGQCKLDDFFARIAADTQADAFIFDAFSNSNAHTINERLQAFVDTIRTAHPTTPLIFLQTEIRETGNFDLRKRKTNLDQRAAAEQGMEHLINNGYTDIYFINPGMPIGSDHEDTVDGTHPTDAGFEKICTGVLPQIMDILNRYGIK